MSISTIVFDAYGTLIDTGDASVGATRDILRKHGSRLDPRVVYASWKSHHRELMATSSSFQLEQAIFAEGLARVFADYGIRGNPLEDVAIMMSTLGVRKLFDDAVPCVQWCRERFQVVIASNTDTAPLAQDLDRNGLVVDTWFTSESLRAYKPRREFYARMLRRLGRPSQEVAFVGDSLDADVLGPRASGMSAIWLNRTQSPRPDLVDLVEITGLAQIPDAVACLQASGG